MYRIVLGKYRGKDVWEVCKGSGSMALVIEVYRTAEAAEELRDTLNRLAIYKARD